MNTYKWQTEQKEKLNKQGKAKTKDKMQPYCQRTGTNKIPKAVEIFLSPKGLKSKEIY